jgi:hypothetical protein
MSIGTAGELLAVLANSLYEARRPNGGKILDLSDVKEWLLWLEENSKKVETWEEFVRVSDLKRRPSPNARRGRC